MAVAAAAAEETACEEDDGEGEDGEGEDGEGDADAQADFGTSGNAVGRGLEGVLVEGWGGDGGGDGAG